MHRVHLMPLHPETHHFLPHLNPDWFYLSRTGLPIGAEPWSGDVVAISSNTGSFQLHKQLICVFSQRYCGNQYACWFLLQALSNLTDLCLVANQNLVRKVLHNPEHVLHLLLPSVSTSSNCYSLRPRTKNRELHDRLSHLVDCNFITRMYFYQSYQTTAVNCICLRTACKKFSCGEGRTPRRPPITVRVWIFPALKSATWPLIRNWVDFVGFKH